MKPAQIKITVILLVFFAFANESSAQRLNKIWHRNHGFGRGSHRSIPRKDLLKSFHSNKSLTGTSRSKRTTLAEKINILHRNNKRENSVALHSPGRRTRYDLKGASHAGIPTPHKKTYQLPVHLHKQTGEVTAMDHEDARLLRRWFKKKGK